MLYHGSRGPSIEGAGSGASESLGHAVGVKHGEEHVEEVVVVVSRHLVMGIVELSALAVDGVDITKIPPAGLSIAGFFVVDEHVLDWNLNQSKVILVSIDVEPICFVLDEILSEGLLSELVKLLDTHLVKRWIGWVESSSTEGGSGPQRDANWVCFAILESCTESVLLIFPIRSKEGVDF